MSDRSDRVIRDEGRYLVAQAEAMLDGCLIDRYRRQNTVPAWLWLNALAHSRWSRLADIAAGNRRNPRPGWDGALSFLASEVLIAAGSSEGLEALQRARLVPLELRLLGAARAPEAPAELVHLVRREIGRDRRRPARPSSDHPSMGG